MAVSLDEGLAESDLGVLSPEVYGDGDPATFGLPLDRYDHLREHAPCYRQEFGNPLLMDRAWVVSRYADVLAIDSDRDTWAADRGYVNFSRFAPIDPIESPFGKPSMLTLDGLEHRRNRRVISRGFTPGRVQHLEEEFRQYAGEVVEAAIAKGTFDFIAEIAHLMPLRALGEVLGVPPDDRARFFRWVDTFASPFDPRVTPSFEEVWKSLESVMAYSLELAELRRREPGEDVFSKIAQAGSDERLSDDELMGNMALLAAGAAESTRNALGHGMHALLRHPDQMRWLRERAGDIPATAINEIVRIASPFIHFVRTATRDAEVAGQTIAAGDRVVMLFASANFDPAAIDDPRRFDLARDPNPHFGFGRGPHACLGKHVAGLELTVLFEELLRRTKDIRPAGEISYVRDSFSRGVYELPVTVVL